MLLVYFHGRLASVDRTHAKDYKFTIYFLQFIQTSPVTNLHHVFSVRCGSYLSLWSNRLCERCSVYRALYRIKIFQTFSSCSAASKTHIKAQYFQDKVTFYLLRVQYLPILLCPCFLCLSVKAEKITVR